MCNTSIEPIDLPGDDDFFSEILFYEVDKNYIDYLYQFDKNIVRHKTNRKYIGIIFTYNDIKYIAPLTSDSGHKKDYLRKPPYNQVTFDIGKNMEDPREQKIGLIRFGNMIPVKDCVLRKININLERQNNEKYGYLLLKQYIRLTKPEIKKEMIKLVKRTFKISKNKNHYLHQRKGGICDLELLTKKSQEYAE